MSEHEKIHDRDRNVCQFGCGEQMGDNEEEHMQRQVTKHLTSLVQRVTNLEQRVRRQVEDDSAESAHDPNILHRLQTIEEMIKLIEANLGKIKIQYTSSNEFGTEEKIIGAVGGAERAFGIAAIEHERQREHNSLHRLPEILEKMCIYEGVMTVLNREVEKLTMQVDTSENLQKSDQELIGIMDRKIKALERQLAMKDATIAELELRTTSLELTSYDGTLIWKIADFSRKRQEAISGRTPSIYSTPFYTSKTGYKMCARIYLNGDGMGRGTHVSIFFVIMRGQYDAMLKWPFRQKVTLMFLDQNSREHIQDAFRPDPTSSSFKRPTSEMNIASGCPLFLSHSQLDNASNAYVKDNTAFIKITVNIDEI